MERPGRRRRERCKFSWHQNNHRNAEYVHTYCVYVNIYIHTYDLSLSVRASRFPQMLPSSDHLFYGKPFFTCKKDVIFFRCAKRGLKTKVVGWLCRPLLDPTSWSACPWMTRARCGWSGKTQVAREWMKPDPIDHAKKNSQPKMTYRILQIMSWYSPPNDNRIVCSGRLLAEHCWLGCGFLPDGHASKSSRKVSRVSWEKL